MVKHKLTPKNECIGICNEQQDDITQYFQKVKPPPPPDNDNSWELQYCRWWGWNWVKKRQELCNRECQSKINDKKHFVAEPDQKNWSERQKKVRKKHFRQLCNCLCFKKPKSVNTSLQELYKTPSNSVVLQETYMCGYTDRHGDSISHLEMRRNVSRTGKREVCQSNFRQIVTQNDNALEEESSCSCQEYNDDGTPGQYKSTEESSEYINVDCCCKREKVTESTPMKKEFQTQTSCRSLNKQVEQNIEPNLVCTCKVCKKDAPRRKKKRLHIICHCCCCKCNNLHGIENKKRYENEENAQITDGPRKCETKQKCLEDYRIGLDQFPNKSYEANKKFLIENVNFLHTMRPWDRILNGTKKFSKFGTPSKKYPWVHSTQSDILDKCYSLRIDEEFSSPISGKKYNLTPIKFDNFDEITTSTLPDPIEVEEDIKYLSFLEDQIKTDFKSRVMLDQICDAILFNAKNNNVRDKSSIFLDEFTFSPRTHDENQYYFTQFLNQRKNAQECSSHVQEEDCMYSESNSRKNHHSMVQQVENLVKNLLSNDDKSEEIIRYPGKNGINNPFPNQNIPGVNINAINNVDKRVVTPILSEDPKKYKCELSSTDSLVQTVDNLIAKIDEITMKGQVNVEKIQNVINLDSLDDPNRTENENYNHDVENVNPSEIFHKIDEIIKFSNDNNDKIGTVMRNTRPKQSNCGYDTETNEYQDINNTGDLDEVEKGANIHRSEELVKISLESEQNNTQFDSHQAVSGREDIDTNLVNIKKKRCFRSMIPVRGKNFV